MNSRIEIFPRGNGEIQRAQCVTLDNTESLNFFRPAYDEQAFIRLGIFYRTHVVNKAPMAFGRMVFIHVPKDLEVPDLDLPSSAGTVYSRHIKAALAFRAGLKVDAKGNPKFKTPKLKAFFEELRKRNCADIVCGRLPHTVILPVGDDFGLLSESVKDAKLRVNSSFFVMDCFDVASPYDTIGTPYGLCAKDGEVLNPPLFKREAFKIDRSGHASVFTPKIEDLTIVINGREYRHGAGASFHERPEESSVSLKGGTGIAVIGTKVAAIKQGGRMSVPASGFLLSIPGTADARPGDTVSYRGYEDIRFAIQVGNSLLIDGVKTDRFISRFYDIKRLGSTPFPPSLYPLNYERSRAARMAIGADKDGKVMIVWAEGAGKLKYVPGDDSTGASLTEMADICEAFGMVNGVNLDGGGSSQININGVRELRISDRVPEGNVEKERAIGMGLYI